MFPSCRNQSVDLLCSANQLTGFYMIGTLVVKRLTVLTEKSCVLLNSIQYKNGCLAASDLFHMFIQSLKFYTFHYHILKSTDAYLIHQIDSKNEWLLLSASFTAKFVLVFVLTLENAFS